MLVEKTIRMWIRLGPGPQKRGPAAPYCPLIPWLTDLTFVSLDQKSKMKQELILVIGNFYYLN